MNGYIPLDKVLKALLSGKTLVIDYPLEHNGISDRRINLELMDRLDWTSTLQMYVLKRVTHIEKGKQ